MEVHSHLLTSRALYVCAPHELMQAHMYMKINLASPYIYNSWNDIDTFIYTYFIYTLIITDFLTFQGYHPRHHTFSLNWSLRLLWLSQLLWLSLVLITLTLDVVWLEFDWDHAFKKPREMKCCLHCVKLPLDLCWANTSRSGHCVV